VRACKGMHISTQACAASISYARRFLEHVRIHASSMWVGDGTPRDDRQGRGGTTGYDNAGALVGLEADGGEGQEELFKETNKVYQVRFADACRLLLADDVLLSRTMNVLFLALAANLGVRNIAMARARKEFRQ
jgi:hypothetical protein